jgi:tRNA modification GTPase
MTVGGVLFRFIDTAGLRKTTDSIEQLGIERSYKKAAEASLVILLGDASHVAEGALRTDANMLQQRIGAGPRVVPVLNKCDVAGARPGKETLSISARSGAGLEALQQVFLDHVSGLRNGPGDIVVTNARHVDALSKARSALMEAKKAINLGISGELLSIDLRRAQHHLGEITGRITTDDLLGSIFGRFCIGK